MKTFDDLQRTPLSLPALLQDTVRAFPAGKAIALAGRVTDFQTFDRLTDRVAAALAARGIVKGDRIGLYCVNSDIFAEAYFGILKAGAVVVPVNLLLNPHEVAYILNDAGAKALLYHEACAGGVTRIEPQLNKLEFSVWLGQNPPPAGRLGWQELIANRPPPPAVEFDPVNDLAAILYTSGTTGQPKGAMLTHHNLASNAASIGRAINVQPGRDVILVVLPMFHAFAATVGMIMPLLHGCALAPQVRFDPVAVADAIAAEGITVLPAVPSMYAVLLRLPDAAVAKFRTLRYCFSGGAALPVEILRRFEARFQVPLCEGDGPTECSPATSVNPVNGVRKPGTIGLPLYGVEMRILDEQGRELPAGQIGEICVRGPNVMKGYWDRPEETRAAFFGAWFRTGDLGTRDADGYFAIVDRKKDMLITNGMNVYPRVIEEILYKHPAVREAAVVGEPHDLHGEIPVAYVALQEGAAADAAAIRQFCREYLGRHEVPRKVFFLTELPKNAAGKILKRQLRKHGELERGVDSRQPET